MKITRCDICKQVVADAAAAYKIKKKLIYKDAKSGFWYGWGSVVICGRCLDSISHIYKLVDS